MKQHIYILILIFSLLSISSKTYSQVDISVRNINRGIELCDEGQHHIGLFYLSIGLRNEELPDSLRNIGELYRQCSYIITDKEKVSNDILENVLPNIKEPLYVSIYAYLHLVQYYIQREQLNKANSYLNKCLNECEKNGRKDSIEYIWCLTDMARIMTKQGNYNATNSFGGSVRGYCMIWYSLSNEECFNADCSKSISKYFSTENLDKDKIWLVAQKYL